MSARGRDIDPDTDGDWDITPLPRPPEPSAEPTASAPAALPELLSIQDACALFGRSDRCLRRWARDGVLVPVRIGGAVYFLAEDIRGLIQSRHEKAILQGVLSRKPLSK